MGVERIAMNSEVLSGKPIIRGNRIPIYLILELLATGMSVDDVLEGYRELTREDMQAQSRAEETGKAKLETCF